MTNEPTSLLIDTNVWIDLFIPSRPGHSVATELLRRAVVCDCTLLYPVRVLADVFYMVQHEAKSYFRANGRAISSAEAHACRNHAWDCIANMREVATAVGADESDVWLASKYRSIHPDLEDDFVIAAAKRAHATYLVTSDKNLVRKAPVAALFPQDALLLLSDS